ncbi:MAG: YggU family protein [Candidatus Omnitrophica bacterium]|nr:YggU family protein [Candidatus Omnitrophota bacterium]
MNPGRLIHVKVITKAGRNSVTKFGDGFKAHLTAPPADGKANKALVKLLSEYFNLKKSQVTIVSGKKSKDKLIKLKEGAV